MKKIAAAALAATMTLSVAAVPAEAASNKMSEYNTKCTLRLDGQRGGTVARNQVRNNKDFASFTEENVGLVRTSSDLGEAFSSSDAEVTAAANHAEAVQACIDGKNYQSQPMTEGKRIGIILGVVFTALSLAASAAAPFVQQFLPF